MKNIFGDILIEDGFDIKDKITSAMMESNKIRANSENKYVLQANEEINRFLVEIWDILINTQTDC